MKKSVPWICAVLIVLAALTCCAGDAAQPNVAWRVVGYDSNAIPDRFVPSYVATDVDYFIYTAEPAGGLQAVQLPACSATATFADSGSACPVVVGPFAVGDGAWTAFDVPVRWPYEADSLVTGQPFAEACQVFAADGDELCKIACPVVGDEDLFETTVHRGGPDGAQIGPAASFKAGGTAVWGMASWKPGEIPLAVGERYYVSIRSRSGKPFRMAMHSTGDIYPHGCAYLNGVPEPGSDLGLMICLQRDDAIRSPVLFATGADGWVRHSKGVYFRARSTNLRAVFARIRIPKNPPDQITAGFTVHRLELNGSLTRIGGQKKCRVALLPNGEYHAAAVYSAGEVPLETGKTYFLEVVPGSGESVERLVSSNLDLLVTVYGEKIPGANPVIYNQRIVATSRTSVKLAWDGDNDTHCKVRYGLAPDKLDREIGVRRGERQVEIHPIAPGVTFCFRLIATSELGGVFRTPVYVARTLDADNKVVTDPPLPAVPNESFLPLAPVDRASRTPMPKVVELSEVTLVNPGFEDGLTGWQIDGSQGLKTVESTQEGASALCWEPASNDAAIGQQVGVTAGKTYMVSAWIRTEDRGSDILARLVCDPRGGTDFAGANSTQWFRTAGKWLRFGKLWKASSHSITIGIAFSGPGDTSRGKAFVDSVRLTEVRPPKPTFWELWKKASP